MDEMDKYVSDNIKVEHARVAIECIKTGSEEIREVDAMIDTGAFADLIQAVCMGSSQEDIGEAFQKAVNDSIGLVAELNLMRKFARGEQ